MISRLNSEIAHCNLGGTPVGEHGVTRRAIDKDQDCTIDFAIAFQDRAAAAMPHRRGSLPGPRIPIILPGWGFFSRRARLSGRLSYTIGLPSCDRSWIFRAASGLPSNAFSSQWKNSHATWFAEVMLPAGSYQIMPAGSVGKSRHHFSGRWLFHRIGLAASKRGVCYAPGIEFRDHASKRNVYSDV